MLKVIEIISRLIQRLRMSAVGKCEIDVATGPIIFLYPFVQKYFISGITVGAVKG